MHRQIGWLSASVLLTLAILLQINAWAHPLLATTGVSRLLASAPTANFGLPLLQNIKQIAVGGYHTCVLTTTGGVKCWGYNAYGQLGDGSTVSSSAPVDVNSLGSGVSAISAGENHTCVVTTSGGVKCWGINSSGQLGNNSTTNSSVPVDVNGLGSGVNAISAGGQHTCARITATSGIKCWGDNFSGQLGNNSTTNSSVPVDVNGLGSGVNVITTGGYHTCAVTTEGGVKCWGVNGSGQLGNNSTIGSSIPVDVIGLSSGITTVSAGNQHTCALTKAGGITCWGGNSSIPVDVSGLSSDVKAISAGSGYTCALTTTGSALCWGSNYYGELGNNSTNNSDVPVAVSDLGNGINAIGASQGLFDVHTCALTATGNVKCWGNNYHGQLGNNSTADSSVPVDVNGLSSGVRTISAGDYHTCALTTSGSVKCWGYNDSGQLGNNNMLNSNVPADVNNLSIGVSDISVGSNHTCAVTSSGGVKCWGANGSGQLGNNSTTNSSIPVDVNGLSSGVSTVSAGDSHTCILTASGGVKCWGYNNSGQLGNNSTSNSKTPVDVSGLSGGVSAISAGRFHTCILTKSNGIKCWGRNFEGQLGNNSTSNSKIPVDVSGLSSGVNAISAGDLHTCALTTVGGVKCWGNNNYGQLGNNSTANSSVPVEVSGLISGVSAISAGGLHTCAVTTSGSSKCWGGNYDGQLGNNRILTSTIPVEVSGLISGVSTISAGDSYTCAVTTSSSSKCWGDNFFGQLGDGNAWHTAPVDVLDPNAPTPTSTSTSTATATACPTDTVVIQGGCATITPTPTQTPTPTGTASSTQTPTATSTATATPTATSTIQGGAGDNYEDDDACERAHLLANDSSEQLHTFHDAGDPDWIRFEAQTGIRYRIEVQVPSESPADVDLELYPACGQLPNPFPNPIFSPNVRLDFKATQTGPIFLRLTNHTASVAGAQVIYQISVRALDENPPDRALIIVAGRLKSDDPLQSNIHHVTGQAYALFQKHGYDNSNIQYLATDPALPGYTGSATKENLRAAITTWAAQQLEPNGVLTLYLIDHGKPDLFLLDELNGQHVTPTELDEWLAQLESQVQGVKVNVIIEACQSGSFIDLPASISRANRLIVTSTTAQADAKASYDGAYFSDHFLTSLAEGSNVYASFFEARRIAKQIFALQEAWVDGNGNGQPNELEDAAVAASRGFDYPGTFDDPWPPHIFSVQKPEAIVNFTGNFYADVRDDVKVHLVWGVVYPPNYTPPPSGQQLQKETLPSVLFTDQGNNQFVGQYTGFTQIGVYRIVIQATDNEGLQASPVVIEVNSGHRLFLPVMMR